MKDLRTLGILLAVLIGLSWVFGDAGAQAQTLIDIDVFCQEVNSGDCDDLDSIDLETSPVGIPSLVGFDWGGAPGDDVDAYCEEAVVGDCDELASVTIKIGATSVPVLQSYTTQ